MQFLIMYILFRKCEVFQKITHRIGYFTHEYYQCHYLYEDIPNLTSFSFIKKCDLPR